MLKSLTERALKKPAAVVDLKRMHGRGRVYGLYGCRIPGRCPAQKGLNQSAVVDIAVHKPEDTFPPCAKKHVPIGKAVTFWPGGDMSVEKNHQSIIIDNCNMFLLE